MFASRTSRAEPGEGEICCASGRPASTRSTGRSSTAASRAAQPLEEPRGLGVDVAGIVERIGAGVSGVAPGEELLGSPITPGLCRARAEPAGAARAQAARASPGRSPAASRVVVGDGLCDARALALKPGETLLILGASGGGRVGRDPAGGGSRSPRDRHGRPRRSWRSSQALGATAVPYGDGLARAPARGRAGRGRRRSRRLGPRRAGRGGRAGGRPERVLTIASSPKAERAGRRVPRGWRRRADGPGAAGGPAPDRGGQLLLPGGRGLRPRAGRAMRCARASRATRRASSWSSPTRTRSGRRQAPGGVDRDPPAAVGAAGVDHGGGASLPEGLAAGPVSAQGERAEADRDIPRGDRPCQLDLDLGAVVEQSPQRAADRLPSAYRLSPPR